MVAQGTSERLCSVVTVCHVTRIFCNRKSKKVSRMLVNLVPFFLAQ